MNSNAFKPKVLATCLILVTTWLLSTSYGAPEKSKQTGLLKTFRFGGSLPEVPNRVADMEYQFEWEKEDFKILVPKSYNGAEPFGLCVFIAPSDEFTPDKGWQPVFDKHKVILLIPQNVGNKQPTARRMGLALVGALKMSEEYRIDTNRVFSSGFSGGARCAMHLAFVHSKIFSGCIAVCGADFYEPIPWTLATDTTNYGRWSVPKELVEQARKNVRFVLLTGPGDFRHGNIVDIFNGGFQKQNFQAMLIDFPKMQHEAGPPAAWEKALKFVGDGR